MFEAEGIEGNWTGHISLRVPLTRRLKSLIDTITLHCLNPSNLLFDPSQFVSDPSLHISLSKSFVLRFYQIEPFLNRLALLLPPATQIHFDLETYCEYFICFNESKTRKFLCLPVEDRSSALAKLTKAIDVALTDFQQPIFFRDPKFHISLGSELCKDYDGPLSTDVLQVPNPGMSSDSDDEMGDFISVVLNLSELTCRVGNKLFLYGPSGFRLTSEWSTT